MNRACGSSRDKGCLEIVGESRWFHSLCAERVVHGPDQPDIRLEHPHGEDHLGRIHVLAGAAVLVIR